MTGLSRLLFLKELTIFFGIFITQIRFSVAFNFGAVFGMVPESLKPPIDLLSDTYLGRDDVELTRCYKASKDGFSAVDFHKCVDGKGSAILVIMSRSGAVFGGFNPVGMLRVDFTLLPIVLNFLNLI